MRFGVERRAADLDRHDALAGRPARIDLDGQPGHLREPPGGVGSREKPVLQRRAQVAAADVDRHHPVAERQFGEHVAPGDGAAGRIDLAAADAAAVGHRGVGAGLGAHRVGDQVADRGLAGAHRGVAAVELDRGGGERHVHLAARARASNSATTAATSGSGVTVAVSMMRNCGHHVTSRRPSPRVTSMVTSISVT